MYATMESLMKVFGNEYEPELEEQLTEALRHEFTIVKARVGADEYTRVYSDKAEAETYAEDCRKGGCEVEII